MDIQKGTYTYTGYNNQKYKVPIERVYSIFQLHKGEHIAVTWPYFPYWHHAIVEDIETEKDIVNAIEYSNSAKEFLQDNSSPPKNPGKAKVRRYKYSGSQDGLYLIKHKNIEPADTVVCRAKSRLGEKKYHLLRNNCEHFALWCKTGISSSEQVENIEKTLRESVDEIVKTAPLALVATLATRAASKGGEEIVTTTLREMTKEVVSQTVSKGGQEIMKASAQTVAKQVVSQTVSKGGQEIMKESAQMVAKQVVSQTVSKGGQEIVKASAQTVAKQVVSETVSKGGQEIMKASAQTVAKEVVSETVSKGGQEIVKASAQTVAKEVVSETVSKGGQEIMKASAQTVAEKVVSETVSNGGQQILTSGTRETTKEVFSHTAKKAGEEIVTKGTRETTREVITETSKTTGNSAGESLVGGAAFAAVFETASAAYDIYRTNEDLKEGKISEKEYNHAVGKRVVGGVGSVVGSAAGAVVGQRLVPSYPRASAFVGGLVGGIAGRLSVGALWDAAKK